MSYSISFKNGSTCNYFIFMIYIKLPNSVRKIFLALNWVSSISISLAMVSAPILALFGNTEEVAGISIWQIIILLLIVLLSLGYAYWLHRAVCGRILLQISILAGVQIIPMLNPVGLIILLAIRSTSKTEISKASET